MGSILKHAFHYSQAYFNEKNKLLPLHDMLSHNNLVM